MSWGAITDEGLAAAASLIGQPLRRDRMQWISAATRDAIRHFAWGIGDNNPLWFDAAHAEASPWGTIVGPPCMLYGVDSTIVAPKLPGVQWIYAGTEWAWFDQIRLGDDFHVKAKLLSQKIKSGRRFSTWVLQTGEIQYRNQNDTLVATALGKCARTPRGDALQAAQGEGATQGHTAHRYTPDELEDIERQVLAEPRQGAEPRYWEDVAVGDEIPAVVKGPLSVIDIMAWYSATQGALHYGGAHGDAVRYRLRHADYHINPTTGAKEAAGRGHLEAATGRAVGMGGVYDVGPQRISWAQHMLTNWMGDHGFLHRLAVSVRLPSLEGDTIWWRGTVEDKTIRDGVAMVEITVEATNQTGRRSAYGSATVALPSREYGAVRLPLANEGAES
ncbi:MAG: MaoC family dehydratase N-terminal domain-containing protein [bacterium]|nr:MaoC family dehydratase N-terminal domain-containing protein [bacterium]